MYTYLGTATTPAEPIRKLKAAKDKQFDLTKARREHPISKREDEIIRHTIRAIRSTASS